MAHVRRLLHLAATLQTSPVAQHKFDRNFEFHQVDEGITLRVVVEGPKDAPLVVFLHGFPQVPMMLCRYL